jgi:hypothetical protein
MPEIAVQTQSAKAPLVISLRKSRGKKKGKKGKRKARRNVIRLGYGLGPFIPATSLCNHRYADSFTLDTSSGVKSQTFSINNMYNPNPLTLGPQEHRPYGCEQLEALYNNYVVVGGTYEITFQQGQFSFTSDGPSAGTQYVGACIPRILMDSDAPDGTGVIQEELGNSKSKMIEEGLAKYKNMKRLGHMYTKSARQTVTGSWSTRKVLAPRLRGKGTSLATEPRIGGYADSPPQDDFFLSAFAFASDNDDIFPVEVQIVMNYKVLWHTPVVPSQST